MKMHEWLLVDSVTAMRRCRVPGGWLYQVKIWIEHATLPDEPNRGHYEWSQPVFVPYSIEVEP